ncbi:MAG TPA: relaxase/mobilization nuclease domain-containing protein [Cyclobacteriaceae bacterium]|nr:relaxase/mobilization nuclease domain-containing protein [Cyclobacteriaceae bacterium]
MTANLIKGKGFRGALRYNLGKVAKNAAEVLDSTFARSTEQGIMKEVQMIRSMRPRLEKYFYHTSINFPPEKNISSDLMKRLGREYLEASGFTQHQFIMFRHFDAAHPHLHILVNRIGYDGQVISDSKDFQRTEDILRRLEIKYDLRQVAPSWQAKQRAATKNEMEMMKRTGEPSQKLKLQALISRALKERPNANTFVLALARDGVTVKFNQASTGHISGISYELAGFRTTGAGLGADYKWASVRKKIDYNHNRDSITIHATNSGKATVPMVHSRENDPGYLSAHADQGAGIPIVIKDLLEPEQTQDGKTNAERIRKKRKKKRRRL